MCPTSIPDIILNVDSQKIFHEALEEIFSSIGKEKLGVVTGISVPIQTKYEVIVKQRKKSLDSE